MLTMREAKPALDPPFGFVTDGFCETIGKTPLIRLRTLSEATGCEILGKAEFLNQGGSVKDRAALGIILDGELRGELVPGGTIVEGTAGNTGIGLALVGNARGFFNAQACAGAHVQANLSGVHLWEEIAAEHVDKSHGQNAEGQKASGEKGR